MIAVIFDFLTAVLDSWSVWNAAAGSEAEGMRWRHAYLTLTYGCGAYRPYEDIVSEAASQVGLPPSAPMGLFSRWDTLDPWPEAPRVLMALSQQGLRLGVATNCSMDLGRKAAARVGVPFDVVLTAEEAGYYKPRPEPYREVLGRLKVKVDQCLFVAGSAADVEGARAVGMPVFWHNRAGLPS